MPDFCNVGIWHYYFVIVGLDPTIHVVSDNLSCHSDSGLQIDLSSNFYCFEEDRLLLASSLPISRCQRSSPRHCRAEEHHSMHEGIFSRNTIVPHF
jgi:hypothetical protein